MACWLCQVSVGLQANKCYAWFVCIKRFKSCQFNAEMTRFKLKTTLYNDLCISEYLHLGINTEQKTFFTK